MSGQKAKQAKISSGLTKPITPTYGPSESIFSSYVAVTLYDSQDGWIDRMAAAGGLTNQGHGLGNCELALAE